MPFAELDGVRLFFTDEGEGPPILFVHGYTCDSHDWSWQLPHFTASHRCIAVDLRGHGRSSAPDTGYEPLVFAADLAALVRHLDCGPVVAIGHSLGALIVSTLAVEHAELVRAVVALDPGYLVTDEVRTGVAPLAEAMAEQDPVPLVQAILGGAYSPASAPFLRSWHLRRAAGVEPHVLRQTLLGMASETAPTSSRAFGEAFLRRRRCPVLSIYTDPSRAAYEQDVFADDRSTSLSWPGSGHWLHQERPAELNVVVDGWLTTLS